MLKMYRNRGGDWQSAGTELAPEIIWIDLLSPTPEEIQFVERVVKIRVPTEESLSEIEASSRLKLDHHVLYLSSPAVRLDELGEAHLTPVGFVINANVLVTVRFFGRRSSTAWPTGSRPTTACRTGCACSRACLKRWSIAVPTCWSIWGRQRMACPDRCLREA